MELELHLTIQFLKVNYEVIIKMWCLVFKLKSVILIDVII